MRTMKYAAVLCMFLAYVADGYCDLITRGFDDIEHGIIYSNQYPEFSISTDTAGFSTTVVDLRTYPMTHPNGIISYEYNGWPNDEGTGNLIIDYYTAPVSLGWTHSETAGPVADVLIYESGILTVSTNLVSDGGGFTQNTFDLSPYSNVTRVEIRNVSDYQGLAFDNFVVTPIPEPSSVLLLLAGATFVAFSQQRSRMKNKE